MCTKLGSTTSHQRQKDKAHKGNRLTLHYERRQGSHCLLDGGWQRFSGTARTPAGRRLGKGAYSDGGTLFFTLTATTQKYCVKRPRKQTKDALLHHDNAPSHRPAVAMAAVQQCGFDLVPQPPCFQDRPPCDFNQLPNLKKYLVDQRNSTDTDVIEAQNDCFQSLQMTFINEGTASVQERWMMCVMLKGDGVEK